MGSTTHTHTTDEYNFSVGNSVHTGQTQTHGGSSWDNIQGVHTHSFNIMDSGISISNSNNNNPIGFGLDVIYVDMTTWETSLLSFPQGSIIMSNGVLVDASLERYSKADGKFIVHTTPETTVGTTTPQSHTVVCTGTEQSNGVSDFIASMKTQSTGDRALNHSHTFSIESEAKYVEPKTLVTRLYHAVQNTSKAVAGTVVFIDDTPSGNWERISSWDGYNLKAGNSDPTTSGSDTHTHTVSGNSSSYDGPNAFSTEYVLDRTCYNAHYHPITGTTGAGTHIPASKKIVPAKLLYDLQKNKERVIVIMT